ncbi:MAG: ATP-binding protein [Deltaproteobacteria bacterium]|nr:ATP-binding protein [Deltaproteobacteria bacterium]
MHELVVLSGKGGTGKTSLVGALAALERNQVLCDADVDAADLHLLLEPTILERHDFYAGHRAVIREDRCLKCGDCLNWCRFQAIAEDFRVNPLLCEGCGVCWSLCPADAVDFPENLCGEWFFSETRLGPLVHACLGVAAENSGKLVALVRQEARRVAENQGREWIITDGPPGLGCPVIASLGDASAVLIVTEPSVSGQHDLERIAALVDHFRLPSFVLVNKADLHWPSARAIRRFCDLKGYNFLGYLPFTPSFTQAQVEGKTILEYDNNEQIKSVLVGLWEKLRQEIQKQNPS